MKDDPKVPSQRFASVEQLLFDALCLTLRALPEDERTLQNAAIRLADIIDGIIDDESRATQIMEASDRFHPSVRDRSGSSSASSPSGDVGPQGARSIRNRPSAIERTRARHPKAYRQWSGAEESQLRSLHEQHIPVEKIAELLERQPGAVYTRLVKLGLIEPLE